MTKKEKGNMENGTKAGLTGAIPVLLVQYRYGASRVPVSGSTKYRYQAIEKTLIVLSNQT
jgi:hypothetical protein